MYLWNSVHWKVICLQTSDSEQTSNTSWFLRLKVICIVRNWRCTVRTILKWNSFLCRWHKWVTVCACVRLDISVDALNIFTTNKIFSELSSVCTRRCFWVYVWSWRQSTINQRFHENLPFCTWQHYGIPNRQLPTEVVFERWQKVISVVICEFTWVISLSVVSMTQPIT